MDERSLKEIWQCASVIPGIMVRPSQPITTSAVGPSASASPRTTETMRSPSTKTLPSKAGCPEQSIMVAFWYLVSIANPSAFVTNRPKQLPALLPRILLEGHCVDLPVVGCCLGVIHRHDIHGLAVVTEGH